MKTRSHFGSMSNSRSTYQGSAADLANVLKPFVGDSKWYCPAPRLESRAQRHRRLAKLRPVLIELKTLAPNLAFPRKVFEAGVRMCTAGAKDSWCPDWEEQAKAATDGLRRDLRYIGSAIVKQNQWVDVVFGKGPLQRFRAPVTSEPPRGSRDSAPDADPAPFEMEDSKRKFRDHEFLYGFSDEQKMAYRRRLKPDGGVEAKEFTLNIKVKCDDDEYATACWSDEEGVVIKDLPAAAWKKIQAEQAAKAKTAPVMKRPAAHSSGSVDMSGFGRKKQQKSSKAAGKFGKVDKDGHRIGIRGKSDRAQGGLWQIVVDNSAVCQIRREAPGFDGPSATFEFMKKLAEMAVSGELAVQDLKAKRDELLGIPGGAPQPDIAKAKAKPHGEGKTKKRVCWKTNVLAAPTQSLRPTEEVPSGMDAISKLFLDDVPSMFDF